MSNSVAPSFCTSVSINLKNSFFDNLKSIYVFYSGLILKRKSPHALKLTVNSAKEGDNTTEFPWYCVGLSDFPMFFGVATENLWKFWGQIL